VSDLIGDRSPFADLAWYWSACEGAVRCSVHCPVLSVENRVQVPHFPVADRTNRIIFEFGRAVPATVTSGPPLPAESRSVPAAAAAAVVATLVVRTADVFPPRRTATPSARRSGPDAARPPGATRQLTERPAERRSSQAVTTRAAMPVSAALR
jgi:hypothetical protein